MKLVLTGGGSGGHTITAISIYKELTQKFKDKISYIYIGSHKGIEKYLIQKEKIKYYKISTGKLRRYFSWKNISDLFLVVKGIIESFIILKKNKSNLIFSTGGFVSVPVVIAAKILNIPIIIHEQTSKVGLANKICGYFANKIAISFPSSAIFFPKKKVVYTGQPIRKELFTGNKNKCYEDYNLEKTLPIIYITGGSQGSHKINQTIKIIIPELLKNMNVIHQCGQNNTKDIENLIAIKKTIAKNHQKRYLIRDFIFINELKNILASINCLISRSGALTVSEVLALKIPSIFIPLEISTKNEQYFNAKIVEKIGSAIIINEKKLNGKLLKTKIEQIILNKNLQEKMKKSFENSTIKNYKNIIDLINNFIKKPHKP